MEIMINNVVFLFSATSEDFYQSGILFMLKILLVAKMMTCDAVTSGRDVTTTRNEGEEREMKNGNKP